MGEGLRTWRGAHSARELEQEQTAAVDSVQAWMTGKEVRPARARDVPYTREETARKSDMAAVPSLVFGAASRRVCVVAVGAYTVVLFLVTGCWCRSHGLCWGGRR